MYLSYQLKALEETSPPSAWSISRTVAAMALDAANCIQDDNSLEKMLAHQMAAAHKLVIEQMGQVSYDQNADAQAKRLNAAARCMAVYQQGLLTLQRIGQNGQQRFVLGIRGCVGSLPNQDLQSLQQISYPDNHAGISLSVFSKP